MKDKEVDISPSHSTPNNSLGPNEILACNTPDGQSINIGIPRGNIMDTVVKPRSSSREQCRKFMDEEYKKGETN